MNRENFEKSGMQLIKNLISTESKLASSSEAETVTSIYQNALAAMALLHENEISIVRQIFDVFYKFFGTNGENFHGFPRLWSVRTGLPDTGSIRWEEDAAFLLLALEFYKSLTGNFGKYDQLADSIAQWLAQKAETGDLLSAEGVAAAYAAFAGYKGKSDFSNAMSNLQTAFFAGDRLSSADYANVLSHIIKGALVFDDFPGFCQLKNFSVTENWASHSSVRIKAYKNLISEKHIDVAVSAQLLLALSFRHNLPKKTIISLQKQLENLWSQSKKYASAAGLPLRVADSGNEQLYSLPSLEPTCYFLFFLWGFNPYKPDSDRHDKFTVNHQFFQ